MTSKTDRSVLTVVSRNRVALNYSITNWVNNRLCHLGGSKSVFPSPLGFEMPNVMSLRFSNSRPSNEGNVKSVHTFLVELDEFEISAEEGLTTQRSVNSVEVTKMLPSFVFRYKSTESKLPDEMLIQVKVKNGWFDHSAEVVLENYRLSNLGIKQVQSFKLRISGKKVTFTFSVL